MRKGYTLTELLVTILLIGLLGGVIIFNVNSISNKNKKKEYQRYIETILSASKVYSNVNTVAFSELYENKAFIYIELGDLVKEGLLDEELKNPYTKEVIDQKEKVKANLDSTGVLTFTYPIDKNEKEVFLVTQDDYVINGETYDCMYGIGTYELTLANEDGTYVEMTAENINKYHFECSMPNPFDNTIPGKYDIKYSWITDSGTKKSGKRKLTVMPVPTPDLEVKDTAGKKYTYSNDTDTIKFKPTTEDCNTFKKLQILPILNGSPTASVEFTVKKKHKEEDSWVNVNYTGDYIPVDDGFTIYQVSTTVTGHHNVEHTNEVSSIIKIEQDITVDSCGVSTEDTKYDISKLYSIDRKAISSSKDTNTYEWKIVNSSVANLDNSLEVDTTKTTSEFAEDKLQIVASDESETMCLKAINNYDKLFVRVITEDGYISSWNEVVAEDLKVTNDLYKIIETADCNVAGENVNNLTGSLNEIKCFYNQKKEYIKYGDNTYVVLGLKNTDGVIAILDEPIESETVLTEDVEDTWETEGETPISTSYTYKKPKMDNLYDVLDNYISTLPENYTESLYNTTWDYKVNEYSFNVPAIADDFTTWISYYEQLDEPTYKESYVGILNAGEARIFNEAIASDSKFFLATTSLNSREITNTENETTTINDNIFLKFKDGDIYKDTEEDKAGIKPVIIFKNINICSGKGTGDEPYIITTSNS
jgi:prepilin-type N-terminal cleavage/methylation domain-containing protein